jgi:hypothetical protein
VVFQIVAEGENSILNYLFPKGSGKDIGHVIRSNDADSRCQRVLGTSSQDPRILKMATLDSYRRCSRFEKRLGNPELLT